uniref:Acyl-CoA-binding domain-containing protein 6 n=1 Tax=Denticeps clupeoides TaxID=299321 RepID=A0AAY4BIF0_9TELE
PGFFDFEGQRKWQAWKQLGDMSAEQACRNMQHVSAPGSGRQPEVPYVKGKRTGFGGAAVSSLYQEEMIREEDKNIFDYCRENNIEHVTKAIESKKVDVNTKDEEGRALLHWACDRGHKDLVSVLLQNNADINSQVNTHQHQYAPMFLIEHSYAEPLTITSLH